MRLQHSASIDSIRATEWDACLGGRGAFAADGVRFLERQFGPHQPPESAWTFHYYRVRDAERPLLATFFTEALWKDDMLAPAHQSAELERQRRADPYRATSKIFAMGSLLTEGNHLFLRRDCDWRRALELLLVDVRARAVGCGAHSIVLRDLPAGDAELIRFLEASGFSAASMPPSWVWRPRYEWRTEEEFLAGLKQRRRGKLRNRVFCWNRHYAVRVLLAEGEQPSADELDRFYELYREVHGRSLEVNTFPLPEDTFREMLKFPGWELLVLELRPDLAARETVHVAVMACFRGRNHYVSVLLGLDYRYVVSHAAYRQTIWRIILRARELGSKRVEFGVGAPLEKERFGSVSEPRVILHAPVSS